MIASPVAISANRQLFRIVDYVAGHLPELTDLWVAAWQNAMPEIDFEGRRGWLVDHLGSLQRSGSRILCAVDERNGAMAGFVTIDPATRWLDQIAVSPSHQGRGAAEALLKAAQQISPTAIRLDVNAINHRARAFYRKQGFVETGRGTSKASGLATIALIWTPAGRGGA